MYSESSDDAKLQHQMIFTFHSLSCFCLNVGRRLERPDLTVCPHVPWMLIQGYASVSLIRFPFSQGLPFVIKIDNIYPVNRFTSQPAQSINSFAYFGLISSWFTPTVKITKILQDHTKNAADLSHAGAPKTNTGFFFCFFCSIFLSRHGWIG